MLSNWLNFGGILSKNFSEFVPKISNAFFPSWTCYLLYLRNGWSNWCETKRKWVDWMLRWLLYLWPRPLTSTFDLEFSRSNCISGMGGPIVMERKGRESIGCPEVKKVWKWVDWALRWLGYLWPLPLTFKVKLYHGNGRPDCHGTKGTGVDRMTWCETLSKWVNWMLRWVGYLWPWPLTFKVKLYLGNGRPDSHGTKETWDDRMPRCETEPPCNLETEDTVGDRGDLRCRRFRRLV